MLRTSLTRASVITGAIKNNAGILTLNRPKALNSINLEMVTLMRQQLDAWMKPSPEIKLVIQNAAGGKAFCAGGDVRSITDAGKAGNTQLGKDFFSSEYVLDYKLATLPVPLVSLIDGITMGGGVGVSVHGTFRVATEKTLFAMPETGIGLFPDVGGGYFLPRLPHKELGTFLALTGHRLKSTDNLHAGVATHVCSKELLEKLTEALTLCNDKSDIEDVLLEFQENSLKTNADLNLRFSLQDHLGTIAECFQHNTVEEIKQALADATGDEWAKKQLAVIGKMSPTSCAISLEQVRRGGHMTLAEVLNMELGIGSECMEQKDFYEGIRAVLVDRDNSPQWAAFDGDISGYFQGSDWKPEEW